MGPSLPRMLANQISSRRWLVHRLIHRSRPQRMSPRYRIHRHLVLVDGIHRYHSRACLARPVELQTHECGGVFRLVLSLKKFVFDDRLKTRTENSIEFTYRNRIHNALDGHHHKLVEVHHRHLHRTYMLFCVFNGLISLKVF